MGLSNSTEVEKLFWKKQEKRVVDEQKGLRRRLRGERSKSADRQAAEWEPFVPDVDEEGALSTSKLVMNEAGDQRAPLSRYGAPLQCWFPVGTPHVEPSGGFGLAVRRRQHHSRGLSTGQSESSPETNSGTLICAIFCRPCPAKATWGATIYMRIASVVELIIASVLGIIRSHFH